MRDLEQTKSNGVAFYELMLDRCHSREAIERLVVYARHLVEFACSSDNR